MSQAWIVLWLATQPASPAQQQHLQTWANSNNVQLFAPAELEAEATDRLDASSSTGATVAHIETLLDRARLAADALDLSAAETLIEQAAAKLLHSPELPQAAWLLAEAFNLEAEIARASGDAERAENRRRAARRLEGQRSPTSSSPHGSASSDSDDSPAFAWRVGGLWPDDQLVQNAVLIPSATTVSLDREIEAQSGLHHVRVLRRDRVIWSAWLDLPEGGGALDLPVPTPAPCSQDDLAPMVRPELRGLPVACDRWILARPATSEAISPAGNSAAAPKGLSKAGTMSAGAASPGAATDAIEVAWCHRNQCGPFESWPRAAAPAQALADQPRAAHGDGIPWWSYALLGTVATATATILILSLNQSRPAPEPVWVYGGVQ